MTIFVAQGMIRPNDYTYIRRGGLLKKLLMGFVLALLSISTFACPDLAGEYTCNNSKVGAYNLTITQYSVAGLENYRITDLYGTRDIIVDGIQRTTTEEGVSAEMIATCKYRSLELNSSVTGGLGLKINKKMSLDRKRNLVIVSQKSAGKHAWPKKTKICRRQ